MQKLCSIKQNVYIMARYISPKECSPVTSLRRSMLRTITKSFREVYRRPQTNTWYQFLIINRSAKFVTFISCFQFTVQCRRSTRLYENFTIDEYSQPWQLWTAQTIQRRPQSTIGVAMQPPHEPLMPLIPQNIPVYQKYQHPHHLHPNYHLSKVKACS